MTGPALGAARRSRHPACSRLRNSLELVLLLLQADAAALADCPNFWVPREVVEGRAPALAAAEQVVQALFTRLVASRLAPHSDSFVGAEYWCQVYEGGRGLGFHFDKVRRLFFGWGGVWVGMCDGTACRICLLARSDSTATHCCCRTSMP